MIRIFGSSDPGCRIREVIDAGLKDKSSFDDVLFLVPEASKASIERLIFDRLSEGREEGIAIGDSEVVSGIFDIDVMSFVKFAQRILGSSGEETISRMDEVILRNVIYHIFAVHKSEFKVIDRFMRRFEYIDMITDLLGDFTRYGVDEGSLDEVLNNRRDDDAFYDKVNDLRLLLSYIRDINETYGLSLLQSDLDKACDLIMKGSKDEGLLKGRLYSYIRELKSTRILIYGFGCSRSFTPQEMRFIKALDLLGSSIDIYVLYDADDPDNDLYYFGKNVLDMFKREKMRFGYEPMADLIRKPGLVTVASEAYARGNDIKAEYDGSIELLRMRDIDDELSYCCNEIIRLTRDSGYRYRDIRIFSPDDSVTERLKGIMRLFNMDAFIDKRVVLENTPVMRYVESFLELPLYGYPIESVLRILRSGLLPVRSEIVDYFENFCLRENIRYGDRIFDEKRYSLKAVQDEDEDEDIYVRPYFTMYVDGKIIDNGAAYLWKALVEKVLKPLKAVADKVCLEKRLSSKAELLREHIEGLSKNIEYLRDEYIDRNDTMLASILVRSYTEVMALLTSFTEPLNDVDIDAELFSSLMTIDMRNKVLASIPLTVDSVEITDSDSAIYTPCKVLFMVGCNSSNFPYGKKSDGVMSNDELLRLDSEMTVDLPDKMRTGTREEFIRAAMIVNCASDRIVIINRDPDPECEVFRSFSGSAVGNNIERICEFDTPVYGLPVIKRHDIKTAKIDPGTVREILGDSSVTSVSSVEEFESCALKFMLGRLLKIKKRDDGTRIRSSEIGTVAHAMFENAFRDIVSENKDTDALKAFAGRLDDDRFLRELSDRYFEEALSSSDLPDKATYLYSLDPGIKARRIFKKALPVLLGSCVRDGYVPSGFEQKLSRLKNRQVFETENGIRFDFTGSIDRIDKDPVTGRIRIVDYKTGNKYVDLKSLSYGVQIQLFAYALAMRNNGSDVDDVGYVEIGLRPGGADEKEGTTFEYRSSGLAKTEFDEVLDGVESLMKRCCREISEGRADAVVNPVLKSGACRFCPYKGLCGNDQGKLLCGHVDPEKKGKKKSVEDHIRKLKERGDR